MPVFRPSRTLAACAFVLFVGGCHANTEKHGENNNVDLGTPFGSLQVKSGEAANPKTGLAPYPGATPVHKHGNDHGSADVNLSFGSLKLGVHSIDLQTPDAQEKVLAFYRKDMSHFGAVLACRGSQPLGQPTRTAQGLTCDQDGVARTGGDEIQLRAGSPEHQHIVGLRTEGDGTRIALVALDLPVHFKEGARKGARDADERE